MHFQDIAFALFASGAFAAPAALVARDSCSDACYTSYNTCRGAPDANRASCASSYASCLGYSPFDSNGSLVTPTACSSSPVTTSTAAPTSISGIPSGCNPAHPGSCPSSYFSTVTTSTAAPSSISGIPGGCNPAHPGSCPSSYFSTVTTSTAAPTSISGIPGGCNPAHPGSCPSSYFSTVTTATAPLASVTEIAQAPEDQTSIVEGVQWTIKQLIRYCSEDGSGCDYNFAISTNDGRADERCTVIRTPGKDATTESWYGIPCTTGSANTISWGFSDQFGADNAFAVLTVTNNQSKTNAYFGVANVNGNPVTPSSPAGSGNFGDIGPQPVYTF